MEEENITIVITRKELDIVKGCIYKVFNNLYARDENANKDTVKTFQNLWSKIKDK